MWQITFSLIILSTFLFSHSYAKNIVILLDGTANSECDYLEEGGGTTNIYRMYEMLEKTSEQLVIYRRGIGSIMRKKARVGDMKTVYGSTTCNLVNPVMKQDIEKRFSIRFGTGKGATANANYALAEVSKLYEDGDRLYIYGFSRGAASAHILSQKLSTSNIPVEQLGLFDPVYAFPVDVERLLLGRRAIHEFIRIGDNVKKVVSLLALDDTRTLFTPSRINLANVSSSRRADFKEVWFAGSHTDIGGGNKYRQLAEITLRYMIGQSDSVGLIYKGFERARGLSRSFYKSMLNVGPKSLSKLRDKIKLVSQKRMRTVMKRKGRSGNLRRPFETMTMILFHPSVETIYSQSIGHTYCSESTRTGSEDCRGYFPQHLSEVFHDESSTIACVTSSIYAKKFSKTLCE